jgi:hypothetical protein
LRESLKRDGCDYPFTEFVQAWDTNITSPCSAVFRSSPGDAHTNDSFLLFGKRHWVKRGFAEVEIRVQRALHLHAAHRAFEIKALSLRGRRRRIARRRGQRSCAKNRHDSRPNANANVIVAGDLNDTKDSKAVRTVIARKNALIDTRPAERNGDDQPHPNPHYPPPAITWTHYYGKEDSYRRIDYILVSRGMAREWMSNETLRAEGAELGRRLRPSANRGDICGGGQIGRPKAIPKEEGVRQFLIHLATTSFT